MSFPVQAGRWRLAASASDRRNTSSVARADDPSLVLRSDVNSGTPGRSWSSPNWPHTSSTNQRSV